MYMQNRLDFHFKVNDVLKAATVIIGMKFRNLLEVIRIFFTEVLKQVNIQKTRTTTV